jgi:hypothetical protein
MNNYFYFNKLSRPPMAVFYGLVIAILGIIFKCGPLMLLGVYDIFVTVLFYIYPIIDDENPYRYTIYIGYILLMAWIIWWLFQKYASHLLDDVSLVASSLDAIMSGF